MYLIDNLCDIVHGLKTRHIMKKSQLKILSHVSVNKLYMSGTDYEYHNFFSNSILLNELKGRVENTTLRLWAARLTRVPSNNFLVRFKCNDSPYFTPLPKKWMPGNCHMVASINLCVNIDQSV